MGPILNKYKFRDLTSKFKAESENQNCCKSLLFHFLVPIYIFFRSPRLLYLLLFKKKTINDHRPHDYAPNKLRC